MLKAMLLVAPWLLVATVQAQPGESFQPLVHDRSRHYTVMDDVLDPPYGCPMSVWKS